MPCFRYTVLAVNRATGETEDLGVIETDGRGGQPQALFAAQKKWPGKVLVVRPDEPMSTCEKCGGRHYTKHPCGCDDPVLIAAKEFLGRLQK
jgi:hypothetical protein